MVRIVPKRTCEICERLVSNSNYGKHFASCSGNSIVWNKGLTKDTNSSLQSASVKMKAQFESGDRQATGAAIWSTDQRKAHAKRAGFGGYKTNAGRSKKFYTVDSFGSSVCLQSSYEKECADLLDELGIKWIRPTHLSYVRDGKSRKYFPDFFLTESGVYLDPKNSFLAKQDKVKLTLVSEQNNVRIDMLLSEHLNKEFIKQYVSVAQR